MPTHTPSTPIRCRIAPVGNTDLQALCCVTVQQGQPGEASATAPPSFDPIVGGFTGAAISGDTNLSLIPIAGANGMVDRQQFCCLRVRDYDPGYGFRLHK